MQVLIMKVRRLTIIVVLFAMLLQAWPARAQALQADSIGHDSIRISLLTCAAGKEIYSLFGHTAIRYENYTQGIDRVYNYGLFDFDTPNFVLRFALGETDYQLGISSYKRFAAEYAYLGRDVWQQTLNLHQAEKEMLVELLDENYRPENRVYRYNFFYDNCSTRPRDMIEKAIAGRIDYGKDMDNKATGITFRDILRQYSAGHPWSGFAMDFCMGPKADEPISPRTQMFVPFNLQTDFSHAYIHNKAGDIRPLVVQENKIVKTEARDNNDWTDMFTPMRSAWLLFVIVTCATLLGIRLRKSFWCMDFVLFAAAGLAGCIPAFLALFSTHPAVSPNYLLFVFHPLHLLCLPVMLPWVRKKRTSLYMVANFIVLTFFITLWPVIPQRFDLAILPLALSLLVRSGANLWTAYKRHRKPKRITTLR